MKTSLTPISAITILLLALSVLFSTAAVPPPPIQRNFMTTNTPSVIKFRDTGADSLAGWDDTSGTFTNINIGTNLIYTPATRTLSAAGAGAGSGVNVSSIYTLMLSTNGAGTIVTITNIPAESVSGVLTNSITGNASTATKSLFVDSILTNSLPGTNLTGTYIGAGLTMNTARILGRTTAGVGQVEELSAGSGVTIAGGLISATGSQTPWLSDINAALFQLTNLLNLQLSMTTSSTSGIIFKGSVPFIHNYKAPGSDGGNVFMGRGAGNFTMATNVAAFEASYNIGFGTNVLSSLTTGYFNHGFGYNALHLNTSGAGNTANGGNSLANNTVGWDNVAIGDASLFANVSSSVNVAVGHNAGIDLSASGAFGQLTGGNTFIGYNANVSSAGGLNSTVTNSTALGAGSTITKKNQMVFGNGITENVFTGDFLSAGTIYANNSGGNLRIRADGTTANDGGIFASGAGDITFGNWDATRGFTVSAGGSIVTIGSGAFQTGGSLGVGVAPGADKLNVAGSGRFSGTVFMDSVGANMRMRADGTTANDSGIYVTAGGDSYFANWDTTRGLIVRANGNISTIGAGSFTHTGAVTNENLTINTIMGVDGGKREVSVALSGLTFDGVTLTATGGGGGVYSNQTITIAGTANQITSSAGAQDLSANRTWTLSTPSDFRAPGFLTVTSGQTNSHLTASLPVFTDANKALVSKAIDFTNVAGVATLAQLPATVTTNQAVLTSQRVQVGDGGRGTTNSSMTIDSAGNVAGISVPTTNLASGILQGVATNNSITLSNLQTTNIVVNWSFIGTTNFTATKSGLHLASVGTNNIITLPNCTNSPVGMVIPLHVTSTTALILVTNANGVQLIGGALSFAVGSECAVSLYNDGSNWHP